MLKLWSFRLVRGHSRSSAMSPFDRACTYDFLVYINRNYVSVFYCFQVIASYLSKVAILTYPTCICASVRGDPV